MQVDADPMKKVDSMYAEIIGINMVDIVEDFDVPITEDQMVKKMEVAYPKAEEDLIDFLNRCKI